MIRAAIASPVHRIPGSNASFSETLEPEDDEHDDLGEACDPAAETLDLAFVGGPAVADHDSREEHGEKAGPVQDRRGRIDEGSKRDRPEGIERLARQRDLPCQLHERPAADEADHGADHHL